MLRIIGVEDSVSDWLKRVPISREDTDATRKRGGNVHDVCRKTQQKRKLTLDAPKLAGDNLLPEAAHLNMPKIVSYRSGEVPAEYKKQWQPKVGEFESCHH